MRYSCAIFRCTYLVKIVCHVDGKQKSITLLENYADLISLYTRILSEERRLNPLGNRSSSTWQELEDRTLDKNTKKKMVSAPELKKVCCFGPFAQLYQTVFFLFSPDYSVLLTSQKSTWKRKSTYN